jgi:hypothetical protein
MMNTFLEWLVRNWDVMVDVFMWGVSVLMAFVLTAKVYKIVRLEFEIMDVASLIFAGLWFIAILIFGFDHIRIYLQGFL